MNEQDPLKLDELGSAYEIVAELGRRENARVFRARYHSEGKRWDDVSEVLVAVSHAPQGDEKHALSLYAADTRLLTRLPHRNLLRVLDGQWIGKDAFAVITEYPQHPSLAELLARGEEFSYARIAAILQEIDSLLEWARIESVIHRGISAETLFLEPETDRALVSFDITAIPLTGPLLPEVDSRTLAVLAWTMLTRSAPPSSVEDMEQPLAELRPDLSARALSQTEALLGLAEKKGPLPNAAEYIATIALAGAMKAGELEVARVEAEVLEQRRLTQEELEAQRRLTQEELDAQREEAERLAAEEAKRIAEQQESFADSVEKQQQELAAQREQLEREIAAQREEMTQAFASERDQLHRNLAAQRAAFEQERAAFLAQREKLEAEIAAERERLARERAELEQHRADVEQYWVEAEQRVRGINPAAAAAIESMADENRVVSAVPLTPGMFEPVDLPEEVEALGDDGPADEAPVWDQQAPRDERSLVDRLAAEMASSPAGSSPYDYSRSPYEGDTTRTRWAMVGGGVALVGLITMAAISMTHREQTTSTRVAADRITVLDSAAGVTVPTVAVPPTSTTVDTTRAAADSVPPARPRRRRTPVALASDSTTLDSSMARRVAPADSLATVVTPRRDRTPVTDSASVRRDSTPRRDTTVRAELPVRPDTNARPDTVIRRNIVGPRDSTLRRDSTARRDSVPRPRPDTVPRPDTGTYSAARPPVH